MAIRSADGMCMPVTDPRRQVGEAGLRRVAGTLLGTLLVLPEILMKDREGGVRDRQRNRAPRRTSGQSRERTLQVRPLSWDEIPRLLTPFQSKNPPDLSVAWVLNERELYAVSSWPARLSRSLWIT